MKKLPVFILGICIIGAFAFETAAEDTDSVHAFQRGATYIRYSLMPEALSTQAFDKPEQRNTTNALTIDQRQIGAIDAYFELVPTVRIEQRTTTPRLYEARWDSERQLNTYYLLPTHRITPSSTPLLASWRIGNLALSLDYNRTNTYMIPSYLLRDAQVVRGSVTAPLGDSGFSLGARLAMYAANEHEQILSSQDGMMPVFVALPDAKTPVLQAGFATSPEGRDESSLSFGQTGRRQNTVLGAVQVSGAVSGVNLFTEVGFAAGSAAPLVMSSTEGTNFYAHGSASYRIGQVTLGLEAGFENGDYSMEALTDDSLGFEHDFLIDDLLDTPATTDSNKVYATVSASMSPTERMMVEGTFSYIKPLDERFSSTTYGMEVNGAFQYSLTNYLKYLVKAGAASLNESAEENRYKITNSLELSF